MKYRIKITRSAEKELRKYSQQLQDRLSRKIFELGNNPRPFGSQKLRDSDYHRIRIGDYRVIYSIDDGGEIVLILDIGHRKDIYR